MTAQFERQRRIVKTDEFSSVFRLRPLFRTDHLVLYAKPNQLTHARLGVVAAKRLAPRAVTRNAVKRAVREGFRQAPWVATLGLDCVVRLSKSLGNKQQSATSAAMQALLYLEVQNLLASSTKLMRAAELGLNIEPNSNPNLAHKKPPATSTTTTLLDKQQLPFIDAKGQ